MQPGSLSWNTGLLASRYPLAIMWPGRPSPGMPTDPFPSLGLSASFCPGGLVGLKPQAQALPWIRVEQGVDVCHTVFSSVKRRTTVLNHCPFLSSLYRRTTVQTGRDKSSEQEFPHPRATAPSTACKLASHSHSTSPGKSPARAAL